MAPCVLAFTGHRPEKLLGYGDEARERLRTFAGTVLRLRAPTRCIVGMAQGWDAAIAEAALSLGVRITAAVPCDGQERLWPAEAQRRYRVLLDRADEVVVVSPGPYAAWKMSVRNEWMVDRGEALVALWDGTPGGTANAVRYAQRLRRPVDNVWPDWIRFLA